MPLSVRLLGCLRLVQDGKSLPIPNQYKLPQFLAFLAYYGGRWFSRDEMVELLWPAALPERGRANLNNTVYQFRKLVKPFVAEGASPLLSDLHSIAINPEVIRTDVADFLECVKAARQCRDEPTRIAWLAKAVETYAENGELLRGQEEEWISPERQGLAELFVEVWRQLLTALEQSNDFSRALLYARRGVLVDRLNEDFHFEVIRLLIAAGRSEEALQQAEEIEALLDEQFGIPLGSRLRALVRKAQSAESPAAVTPLPTGNLRPSDQGGSRGFESPDRLELEVAHEIPRGAVPLRSRYYVVRETDQQLYDAIGRREPLVLLKGPRQVGKTSLLARALQVGRESGCREAFTSLQAMNSDELASAESQARCMVAALHAQLDLNEAPSQRWDSFSSPNQNLEQYLRRALRQLDRPLLWALDEVDRLFHTPFGSDLLGLIRTWSQYRSLDPSGPWERLILVIAYSTEPHLLIRNLDQSPFNVGLPLELGDFTEAQVEELHQRYGAPLSSEELGLLRKLLGGQPYLVRTALFELARHGARFPELLARATDSDWIFGDHLRRIAALLGRDPELADMVRELLAGRQCLDETSIYRLRSAGLLAGSRVSGVRMRTGLYEAYLRRQLC